MSLQTSVDWPKIERELLQKAKILPHAAQDLQKICKNIQLLVSQLSKEEIKCRKLKRQTSKHIETVEEINKQIDFFEQLITFAALFQKH